MTARVEAGSSDLRVNRGYGPLRFAGPIESPDPLTYSTIFTALEAESLATIGKVLPRALVIPLCDESEVVGGLWGCTLLGWLHIQMLFVPSAGRGRGVGAALLDTAEAEARARGCVGAHVDSFSFQAPGFYRRRGYAAFGELLDCPPGHSRIYLWKRLAA